MSAKETDVSQSPFGPEETFATHYCRSRRIAAGDYAETLFNEALYPHARIARLVLSGHYFAADRLFIMHIGRIRRRREFNNLMLDFTESYENHTWWRDILHLRVSVKRLHIIVWEVFAEARARATAGGPPAI